MADKLECSKEFPLSNIQGRIDSGGVGWVFLKMFEEMKVQQWAATKDEGDDAEGTWKTEDSNP